MSENTLVLLMTIIISIAGVTAVSFLSQCHHVNVDVECDINQPECRKFMRDVLKEKYE